MLYLFTGFLVFLLSQLFVFVDHVIVARDQICTDLRFPVGYAGYQIRYRVRETEHGKTYGGC